MIDYHGNCVVLADFTAELTAQTFTDPKVSQAKSDALGALAGAGGSALLGAFAYHLFSHAASDGAELALLERASDLWKKGIGLYSAMGSVRADHEGALVNPSAPGAAVKFNAAAVHAQKVANTANDMLASINALRVDVIKYPHLPPHPRQKNIKADTWDWGNFSLTRRTDAFVRALLTSATGKRSTAFALGAASAYGANVAGSAYIGQTVGGPRRLHRFRDRIGRNAVGEWLSMNSSAAKPLSKMIELVSLGASGSPDLPTELANLLHDATGKAFHPRPTAPPNFNLGYHRLIKHMALLDGFGLPLQPAMPPQVFVSAVMSDPSTPPPSLKPQDVDVNGQDGGGVGVQLGADPNPGSPSPGPSDDNVKKGCGIAFLIFILIDLLQAFVQCCVQWGKKQKCTFWDNMLLKKLWEQDPPSPTDPTNPQVQSQQLTAMADSPELAQFVWMMFDTHNQMWEALAKAREFLVLTGLIYPGDLISKPLYAQFTSLPGSQPWPHREENHPMDTYVQYPASPLENPTVEPSPYPTGANPAVILQQGRLRGADVTFRLWRQVAEKQLDSQNLDLDADRGFGHPCWAASNSVLQDPVNVVILKYDEQ